jgi:ACS family tartrate transporter-like MFS transporter
MASAESNHAVVGTSAALSEAEQNRVIRKVAMRLIPVLGFAYFFNSLDKSNIGLAALQMNHALGLTNAAFGLASGLLFVGYAVFEVPSNLALYKFGARRWISRIMISWGLMAAATAFVQGPGSLYILRILLGIAEAGFYPGVLIYLTMWIPVRKRGQMFAWFVFGGALSGVIGSPLTGLLLTPSHYFGLEGWRAMFLLEGLPAVLVGLLCLVILRDRPEQATWLSDDERHWLKTTLDAERTQTEALHVNSSSLRLLADAPALLMSLIYFCAKFGQYALSFFLPLIIVDFETAAGHHYSTLQVSLLTAIPAACSVIPAIMWAAHSDRTGERIWHAALPMFIACVGICASAMFHDPWLIMIAICIANIGTGAQSAPFYQVPNTFLTGMAAAATFALINSIGNLGGFVAPYAFGLLRDWTGNYVSSSYLMGGVLAVGGVLTVAVLPKLVHSRQLRSAALSPDTSFVQSN